MLPWSSPLSGRFDELTFESQILKDNPLHDPYQRPLWIYLPPGYDEEPERRYPSVYIIQGLTGQLDMWRNRSAFRRNFPELADEMFAKGEAPLYSRLGRLLDHVWWQPVCRLTSDREVP